MTIKIEDRDTAARHIDAIEVTPDVWVYLPAEVSEHYTVTSEDLETLGRDLRLDTPDAYSLWCTVCGRESTDDEIAAHFYFWCRPNMVPGFSTRCGLYWSTNADR